MAQPPTRSHNLIRGDRRMFSASDDTTMLKQIQATHAPDGREVDVGPVLKLIIDIFHHAKPTFEASITGDHDQVAKYSEETAPPSVNDTDGMLEALAFIIQKVSCEIACKCSGGGDAHASTMSVLSILSSYSWDAKIVIALAAFAVTHGEFFLVILQYSTSHLAKSISLLKQLPNMIEHSAALRSRFDVLNNLIKAMMDVTKCVIAFRHLPQQYISVENPPLSTAIAHIPTAAYWTIRSLVACAAQIASFIGMSYEFSQSTTESWELSSLAHKERNIHDHLMQQLSLCNQHIEEKKQVEAYHNLVRLFETPHMDNIRILKALIYSKDDQLPLYDCSNKKRVQIEVLRKKTVLLLISDLDLPLEELMILDHIYNESRQRPEYHYEIVWLPVVERKAWTDADQHKFDALKGMMSWYTINHPTLLEMAPIKYMKEVWHFLKKQILVVLDPQGRVASHNALHMVWIWGNQAYPFTSTKEEALWREETWRIELLIDNIDPNVDSWLSQGKYICLYGGANIDWITNFTKTAKEVSTSAGISLEMIYVGKSKAKERVKKNIKVIEKEELSHYWPDLNSIWYFWTRLECMLYSKMQHGKTVESDKIMQEVMTILSFDGSEQEWAIIFIGSAEMARANGVVMLESFNGFPDWKDEAKDKGFVVALIDQLKRRHTPQHCNRLILPGIEGGIPERVVCAECGRAMESLPSPCLRLYIKADRPLSPPISIRIITLYPTTPADLGM
ncbi:hypothetical protein V2J09_006847 [Rumex salicifolius]